MMPLTPNGSKKAALGLGGGGLVVPHWCWSSWNSVECNVSDGPPGGPVAIGQTLAQ